MIKIINGIEVPSATYNHYITDTINKIFKLLPIYEECIEKHNFDNYDSYLDKLIVMLLGSNILFEERDFLSLVSILQGMQSQKQLSQKKIKSLVFHCIDILGKIKLPSGGEIP